MNERSKPVFEAKLRQIQASVFKNHGKGGTPFYNTHLVRRYQQGEEWINSSYFTGEADLVLARELIGQALAFLEKQNKGGE